MYLVESRLLPQAGELVEQVDGEARVVDRRVVVPHEEPLPALLLTGASSASQSRASRTEEREEHEDEGDMERDAPPWTCP